MITDGDGGRTIVAFCEITKKIQEPKYQSVEKN